MSFENSPFSKSLYLSGTPKKQRQAMAPSTPMGKPETAQTPSSRPLAAPATPQSQIRSPGGPESAQKYTPNASKPSTPSKMPTGHWEHPAMKDVMKRTVNKELVLRKSLINAGLLVASYFGDRIVRKWTQSSPIYIATEFPEVATAWWYLWTALQVLFAYNILIGVYQLLRPQESFDDLAFTPSQRKLLGLPESPKTVSPADTASPPRYLKSSPHTRISPRPSPLSKSTTAGLTGSPLSKFVNSPSKFSPSKFASSPRSNREIVASPSSPAQTPTTANPAVSPLLHKSTLNSTSLNATNSVGKTTSAINKFAHLMDTPSNTSVTSIGTPFTPTGRYIYMADTPSRRTPRD
ncbi:hypothetical protein TRVA0_021S00430 [Trichomonascus vanleenenianus]|uniref:Pom34p n=1 Tax=Trichomonascus vanleenenianus TaxID=2268995 RepID=UPI003ECB7880